MKSVNDKIHDDLIAHDIDLLRLSGDARRRAEVRLDEMAGDIKALLAKIDPFGTERNDARERRLAKFQKEARMIIRKAYKEIEKENRSDLRRLANIESQKVVNVIGGNLP